MNYEYSTSRISHFVTLGNLPVKRAKDAVWFLQWCGVSLVSSYAMCFLQRGGVSLASSAIIYNIVKVKVTHWPVDPFDSLICRPVDLFEKEPLKGNCEVHLHTPSRCDPSTRLTRWPVDLLEKEPLQGQLRGPHTNTVEMHCSKRRRSRLQQQAKGAFCSCVAWGWRIYNIVEGESNLLTHRPVDLFEKEPLKDKWEVNLHTPTKFGEDPSKDLRGNREQTNTQTNAARIILWF